MRYVLAAGAAAAAIVMTLAAPALGEPPAAGKPTAALVGRIQEGPYYDGAGNPSWTPLVVAVDLIDQSGRVVGTANPNPYGEFRFAHVAPGTYTVSFTYPSLFDLVSPFRTYTRVLTWANARDSFELLVDIDPYTNTPSYDVVNAQVRCPQPVPADRGCNR